MTRAPLRLLLTADAVGGVWQYALDLARALRPLGIEPAIALMGPEPSAGQRREAADLRVIETGLPLDWLCEEPAPVLAAGRAVATLARREGADIVQLNMPTLAPGAGFSCPVIAVAHGCLGTWWRAAHGEAPPAHYAWHGELMARGVRLADAVVAPTAAYAETIRRHYALAAPPRAVHNGRTPFALSPAPMRDFVFTAGRLWDRVKNIALLDRVAARLPVPFLAAGAARGPHGEAIGLDHLVGLGRLDEQGLADRLAERPIFVSAACFEPFGLAVLEAAQAGCALVLSDIPTFRELWEGAALFVSPGDEGGFERAIRALLGDRDHRVALGEAARERAGRYTPAAMAEGMARLCRALLSPREQGRAAA
ncbi:MAG TPA: glycosyltransferase family 4 protein [Sphingomonas sp.]|nr:glycosyltransferase family 4 protein [Sphingomonas sp.]